MSKRRSLGRRALALLTALTLCVGLLQLPAFAEGTCRLGGEGCICTEEACDADCAVCHPAEPEADPEPEPEPEPDPAAEADPTPDPETVSEPEADPESEPVIPSGEDEENQEDQETEAPEFDEDQEIEIEIEEDLAPEDEEDGEVSLLADGTGDILTEAALQEAVAAGGTVALGKNIALAKALTITKDVTLDLGGCKLTRGTNRTSSALITVNGGHLTITGSGEIHSANYSKVVDGKTKTYAGIGVTVTKGGLTVESGTIRGYYSVKAANGTVEMTGGVIDASKYGMWLDPHTETTIGGTAEIKSTGYGVAVIGPGGETSDTPTKLTVNGGKITAALFAVAGNGSVPKNPGESDCRNTDIVINGGELTSTGGTVIYHPQQGTLTINGGTLSGMTGIDIRAGVLKIPKDSTAEITGDYTYNYGSGLTYYGYAAGPNGSGATTYGVGIAVSQHTTQLTTEVYIDGGTIRGYFPLIEEDLQDKDFPKENVKVEVTGGLLECNKGDRTPERAPDNPPGFSASWKGWAHRAGDEGYEASAIITRDQRVEYVSGGTYTNMVPEEYWADGYVCHLLKQGEKWYEVHTPGSAKDRCQGCKDLTYALYVAAPEKGGSDETGTGTREAPYATLAHAAAKAPSGATIYVLSDLTMTKCARYWGKDLTIKGVGDDDETPVQHIVTRGDGFNTQNDSRSWYNPAMIEVNGSLRLESIVFDDADKAAGTVFKQALKDGTDNDKVVQDAIIASYDGTGRITLGSGAELRNFGGMSAVRLTGSTGAFTMEAGSKITGGGKTSARKSDGPGAAGAVWLQNGTVTMMPASDGAAASEISGITGRAIFTDGAESVVEMGGLIKDITGDSAVWNASNGMAIYHKEGKATATVSGTIDNVQGGNTVIKTDNCTFTLTESGEIKNCDSNGESGYGSLIYASHDGNPAASLVLNGKITECKGKIGLIYYVNATPGIKIGPSALISKNECQNLIYDNSVPPAGRNETMEIYGSISNNTVSGCVLYGGNNGRPVDLYGKIDNNTLTGTGSVVGFGTNRRVTMKPGSEIKGNQVNEGAVVAVNGEGNCFLMEGGEISGNTVTKGSVLRFCSGSWNFKSVLELNNGAILENTAPHTVLVATGGKVPCIDCYLQINDPDIVGNSVYFDQDGKTVVTDSGTKLGNASINGMRLSDDSAWPTLEQTSRGQLNEAAKTYGCKEPFATFWAQNALGTPVTVTMDTPVLAEGETAKFDLTKAVYALIQATGTKGIPETGTPVSVLGATVENGKIKFNLPGNDNGYAVALVQLDPDAVKGTLDLTVDPTEAFESSLPTELRYTAVFTPKGENIGSVSQDLLFSTTLGEGKGTLNSNRAEWTGTLTSEAFKADGTIDAVAVLTITVDGTEYKVLSNTVSTGMTGLRTFTVTFNWANGGTQSFTVAKGETVTAPSVPSYTSGNYLYTFREWSPAFNPAAPVNADAVYTAQYNSAYTGTPAPTPTPTPTPGGGGGGGGGGRPGTSSVRDTTTITDPTVPLAGDLQLNTVDHFAYIKGYDDNTVRPNNPITRAQVATVFYRLLTNESRAIFEQTTNDFSDVDESFWANTAISTLSNAGVVTGFADGTFRPNASITRAQFATMCSRFFQVIPGMENPFSDVPEDFWARDAIAYASSQGWVGGYTDGTFRPNATITRAAAMKMVNNLLNRGVDQQGLLDNAPSWKDNRPADWFYFIVLEATTSHNYERRSEDAAVENWTELTQDPTWN